MSETFRDRIKSLRRVKAGDLVANPKNWRRHPEAQRGVMSAALAEIGLADALLVRETDQGLLIIDGHLRADLCADQEVPVLVLDLTADEADKLLATLDPLAAMAEIDMDALGKLAGELKFDSPDLDSLVASLLAGSQAAEVLEDGSLSPQDGPCVAQVGDVWACGRHRVVCGDATDEATTGALLGDVVPDLMLTDPPYGVGFSYESHDDSVENLEGLIADVIVPGIRLCVCAMVTCGNGNQHRYPFPAWTLAWTYHGIGRGPWGFTCWQPVLAYGKDPFLAQGQGCRPDAFDNSKQAVVHTEEQKALVHSCPKPMPVWCWLIERGTAGGKMIYDPFLGSGTTLIAAEQLGRTCYGIEIEPKYIDVILQRYLNFTDVSPVRESDGAKFSDLVTTEAV